MLTKSFNKTKTKNNSNKTTLFCMRKYRIHIFLIETKIFAKAFEHWNCTDAALKFWGLCFQYSFSIDLYFRLTSIDLLHAFVVIVYSLSQKHCLV